MLMFINTLAFDLFTDKVALLMDEISTINVLDINLVFAFWNIKYLRIDIGIDRQSHIDHLPTNSCGYNNIF
mgnify:CR=1 FL=1